MIELFSICSLPLYCFFLQEQHGEVEPWEELDIDESDLDNFICCCNSNNTMILGLDGIIQVAMVNRRINENILTQQFLTDITKASFDRDFISNAWLCA